MSKVTRADIPTSNEVPPRMKGSYTLRVLKSEFGPAKKSQNPQLVWECEIVEPKTIKLDGKEYLLDSMKHTYYFPIMIFKDGSLEAGRTQQVQDRFLQVLKALGFPEEFDTEDMKPEMYEGLVFDAILDSKEDNHVKPDGKGGWVPVLDAFGKPISKGWIIYNNNFAPAYDILQRNTLETNRAF